MRTRSFYTILHAVLRLLGRIENHIGDLKRTFGVLRRRFRLRHNKLERFDAILHICLALHNIKYHFNNDGTRRAMCPEFAPQLTPLVRQLGGILLTV